MRWVSSLPCSRTRRRRSLKLVNGRSARNRAIVSRPQLPQRPLRPRRFTLENGHRIATRQQVGRQTAKGAIPRQAGRQQNQPPWDFWMGDGFAGGRGNVDGHATERLDARRPTGAVKGGAVQPVAGGKSQVGQAVGGGLVGQVGRAGRRPQQAIVGMNPKVGEGVGYSGL
jgi:hypothetical protein